MTVNPTTRYNILQTGWTSIVRPSSDPMNLSEYIREVNHPESETFDGDGGAGTVHGLWKDIRLINTDRG